MEQRRKRSVVLLTLAALALLVVARGVYIVYRAPEAAFRTPAPSGQPAVDMTELRATPAPTLSPEERLLQQADPNFMQDRVNILLVGFDASPERADPESDVYREEDEFRSDVLMLAAVNFAENRVHLISIPRDTYAAIYGTRGRWKINAAFTKGGGAAGDGFLYARKTVELLMGVPVDYHAGVDMAGLKTLVDGIGGVDYDVDVEIALNGRVIKTGMQHLNGQQVLDYCRARKGISTDVGRADRQQRMLVAIFRQLQDKNELSAIPALYAAVRDDLYTNLTAPQVAALAAFALRLDEKNIRRTTLAGEYINNVYNASYYVLYNKKLAALVKEEFGVTIRRDPKYDVSTVRRDKAAAEAKKAAEEAADVESMLVLPAGATGGDAGALLAAAREEAARLAEMVELGASASELLRQRHVLMRAVKRVLTAFSVESGVPESFQSLIPR